MQRKVTARLYGARGADRPRKLNVAHRVIKIFFRKLPKLIYYYLLLFFVDYLPKSSVAASSLQLSKESGEKTNTKNGKTKDRAT